MYYKVLAYLEANSKTVEDFKNIELQNDGSGDYIKTWNVSGLAKPNDSQLNALNSTATTKENNSVIFKTRKINYGNWQDQLDKLYHDIDDGKLDKDGTWYKHIKAVKDANAKE
jgi:hypothetical protein